MEKGEFYNREKNVVQEGSEVAGQEVIVDYSDDECQVFDEMPVRGRLFYFIKVLPLENTEIDSIIKMAEERIDKANRDKVVIARKIRERMMERDAMRSNWSWMNRRNYEIDLKWYEEKLDILHQSLGKLTFANNAYREKSVNSCVSEGEVDKQKLSILMAHSCKNMADERKLSREINAIQGKDGGMTLDELEAPIQRLRWQSSFNYVGHTKTNEDARKQGILKDTRQHALNREKAIANAVVNGKLWNSLSSKKSIQEELQVLNKRSYELRERQREVNANFFKVNKELKKLEKDICSLQKLYKVANHKKDRAYNTILRLKKQYGEENGSYYQYRSLMKKVEAIAKKKDIAAIQELSQLQDEHTTKPSWSGLVVKRRELKHVMFRVKFEDFDRRISLLSNHRVGKFMQQWNDSLDFRNDYKKRVTSSLNTRQLGVDGRMVINQKPEVEDSKKVIKPEALSKSRLKWLMKDVEDPYELLYPFALEL